MHVLTVDEAKELLRQRDRCNWTVSTWSGICEKPSWVEWEIHAGIRRLQRAMGDAGEMLYKLFHVEQNGKWLAIAESHDFQELLFKV